MSVKDSKKIYSRRFVILGAGAAAAGFYWYGIPFLRRSIPPTFTFKPVPGLERFRLLDAGDISQNLDPLAGLEMTDTAARETQFQALEKDLCGALFGVFPRNKTTVSIASFSDYRCPYCRILTPVLAEWQASDPAENHVEWHEWPLLGDPSSLAARAALAAKRQGAYPVIHERLMRSAFVATPAYLKEIAASLDLDATQLLADMDSPSIMQEIATSRALAALFGFPGTPALVVGKTVVIGAISKSDLYALIDLERREGSNAACQTP